MSSKKRSKPEAKSDSAGSAKKPRKTQSKLPFAVAGKIATDAADVKEAKPDTDALTIMQWNVNGVRAAVKNGCEKVFRDEDPDIICLCEVKADEEQSPLQLSYPFKYWNSSKAKKGYSGTAIFSRVKPLSVTYDMPGHDQEGRMITLEFNSFVLVHTYVPNSGQKLERLDYRCDEWDVALMEHVKSFSKPVILTGDLNVGHLDIDVHDPKRLRNKVAGFHDRERDNFRKLLKDGFVDAFRHLHPEAKGEDCYTYVGHRSGVDPNNLKGWRLDYFVMSSSLVERVSAVKVCKELNSLKVRMSDHIPIILSLKASSE